MKEPTIAPLFDAAFNFCRQSYGEHEQVAAVTVHTVSRARVRLDVPAGWTATESSTCAARIKYPECFADTLWVLVDTGHRMTRQAIVDALEERKRKWSESHVAAVLSQAAELGILNNRQEGPHKGYGLPDWS